MAVGDFGFTSFTSGGATITPPTGTTYKIHQYGSLSTYGPYTNYEWPQGSIWQSHNSITFYAKSTSIYYDMEAEKPINLYCSNTYPISCANSDSQYGTVAWVVTATTDGPGSARCGGTSSPGVAPASSVTIQPSSGEEWMVVDTLSDQWYSAGTWANVKKVGLSLYNGNNSFVQRPGYVPWGTMHASSTYTHLHVTNSMYFRLYCHDPGSWMNLGYNAVRIK